MSKMNNLLINKMNEENLDTYFDDKRGIVLGVETKEILDECRQWLVNPKIREERLNYIKSYLGL